MPPVPTPAQSKRPVLCRQSLPESIEANPQTPGAQELRGRRAERLPETSRTSDKPFVEVATRSVGERRAAPDRTARGKAEIQGSGSTSARTVHESSRRLGGVEQEIRPDQASTHGAQSAYTEPL